LVYSDILAFVEPHMLNTDSAELPGYQCVQRRNCRTGRNSEGSLIFSKSQVHVKLDTDPSNPNYYRYLQIRTDFSSSGHYVFVHFQVSDVNLIMVYKSPNYSVCVFLRALEEVLISISGSIIVFGDFNIDLHSPVGRSTLDFFNRLNLESKLNYRTSSSTDGSTFIDFCFSNIPTVEAWFYETYYSYHKAICLVWPKN
jgi:hypothetical protein